MSALSTPVVLYCERCRRRTPHSQRGKCLELHRTKRLHYTKPADELARWHAVKAQVFERDDFECQFPADAGQHDRSILDAHHRALLGAGGVSDDEQQYGLANLVSLCRHHHGVVHNNRPLAERMGFVLSRFGDVSPSLVPIETASGWVQLLDDGTRVPVQIYARDDE